MKTLDVGCGAEPRGDVNIDYFINDRSQCITAYDPKRIPNFIRADSYPLPFRDNSFEIVRASARIRKLGYSYELRQSVSRTNESHHDKACA